MPRVKKFGPAFIVPKFSKFSFFDNFLGLADFSLFGFSNLDNVWDLANFLSFNFFDFLACSILSLPNLSTLLLLSFFPEASLLPLFLLGAGSLGNPVVFNIEVSEVAILLKP